MPVGSVVVPGSSIPLRRGPVRTGVLLALLGGLALAPGCSSEAPPPPVPEAAALRSTPQGPVQGFTTERGAHAWRGIPFAKPPVGPLRWRAPQPPADWSDPREAVSYGASCVQFAGLGGAAGEEGEVVGSEDCLYLNVYAPPFAPDAVPQGAERLPVMVWIHGGGNSIGDATLYDASYLAKFGPIIGVTIHYRLGVFGWLGHPALREGVGPADASGNYGTLDVIAALEWVQRNIAAFGGDPDRVLVFGESAGGTDTYAMLLSPLAEGLFHRAVAQSGSTHTTALHEAESYRDAEPPGAPFGSGELLLWLLEQDGRAADRAAAKQVVAGMEAAEIAAYLRAQPPERLLAFFEGFGFGGMYPSPELLRDGYVLPAEPAEEALAAGRFNRVPVIVGSNREESKLFAVMGSRHVTRVFGIPLWVNDEDRYDATTEYPSMHWKLRGVDRPARAIRGHQQAVWAYRFDWDEQRSLLGWDLPGLLGAAHALEIPFVFGSLELGAATPVFFDPDNAASDRALADAMMSYWTQFAYTGDPGRGRSGDLPRWPAWSGEPGGPRMLVFDTANDGGIRPSGEEVDVPAILAKVREDPRLRTPRDRCEVFAELARRGGDFDPEQYARFAGSDCGEYPIEDYPWET